MRIATLAFALLACASAALAQPPRTTNLTRERAMPPYRNGFELLRVEAWEDAVKSFRQAVDIDPTFEMAWYGLGRAYMPQKKYVDAAEAFAKSRDLFREQGGRQFANAQEAQRYRRDRILELDDVIRSYQAGPQNMRVAEILRQLNDRRRHLQEAIQRGDNITIENTIPAYVSLSLGSAFFRLGKIDDAEREYKAAISADPKSGESHNNLAVVYMETGRFDEAEKSLKAAEKAGFKVHPQLKEDIKSRRKGTN
jgi:tetratricopeptide (TPR) repeat protein